METFLLTYDLKDVDPPPHRAFTNAAEDNGWSRYEEKPDGVWRLPNTTLLGQFVDEDQARRAMRRAEREATEALGVEVKVSNYYVTATDKVLSHSNRRLKTEAVVRRFSENPSLRRLSRLLVEKSFK